MPHGKRYSISKRYSWSIPQEQESQRSVGENNLLATGGRIAWLADLDTARTPAKNYRRTSIICTIGPKTNSVEAINKLRTVILQICFVCPSSLWHPTTLAADPRELPSSICLLDWLEPRLTTTICRPVLTLFA